jgi:DNA-binding beta-propeller fold protein YncE
VITTVAGCGKKGFAGDGGPATSALLDEPYGLALDSAGNLYFADRLNARVRRVEARTGLISTVAGDGKQVFAGDGGPPGAASLVEPNGVAIDGAGRLFIADVADHRVRVVNLAANRIETFAGTGEGRHAGDDGPCGKAPLHGPRAVKIGSDGALLILEREGNRLRRVDPRTGVITTIAGTGKRGYAGDGGPATEALLDGPKEMAVDREGNVYIVDTENHAIRRFDAATGRISTVAGNGKQGGGGDGGLATEAQLDRPHGVAVGPDGLLYIGDTSNHRIRRLRP